MTNTWTTKAGMPTGRLALTAAAANGRIYAIGGIGGLTTVEEYDPNPTVVADTGTGQPVSFTLQQNYPTSFNPSTSIGYEIAKASPVVLRIFNVFGQEVRPWLMIDRQPVFTRRVGMAETMTV